MNIFKFIRRVRGKETATDLMDDYVKELEKKGML